MLNKDLLRKMLCAGGLSGDEADVREIILNEIAEHCTDVKVDALGNILAFKKGNSTPKNKLVLSAHMDEVGLIVTSVTDGGFLKFDTVGGIEPRVLAGKRVKVGGKKLNGVISSVPVHLTSAAERDKYSAIKQMYIDIGALNKEDAQKYVRPGDSVVFESGCEISDSTITSKAIDDRVGCCILIELLKHNYPCDVHFVFAVQEEVGMRGAKTAAFALNPDSAIVIESTTAQDLPDVASGEQVCTLGGGAAISFMDKSAIYDKQMYSTAQNIAERLGIPLQAKQAVAGGNDSGAYNTTAFGARVLAISAPTRYLHSQLAMCKIADVQSVFALAKEMIMQNI